MLCKEKNSISVSATILIFFMMRGTGVGLVIANLLF